MAEKVKKYKPRVSPWIMGTLVAILLTVLVLLQSSNLWKWLTIESVDDRLALYALSTLNFVAFVIFAFSFLRSLLKIRRERRELVLGSQLKSRLLRYFFAVSLLPITAMSIFSYLFLNRALERWFTDIPVTVINEARSVQKQAIEDQTVELRETAKMLVAVLENQTIDDGKLARVAEQGNLTRLEILAPDSAIIHAAESSQLSDLQKSELEKILALVRQNNADAFVLSDGEGFDAAAAVFSDGRRLIVVPNLRPETSINQAVEKSVSELDKLKQREGSTRRIGLSVLGLLTFLLIFASSWTAIYIARGLTAPISALAEGSDEIARGNYKHRVETFAEDELALLVAAFNQMSAGLEKNAAELSERRKYIETILQSLSTGVISFDSENRVTTINQAAVKMLKPETTAFENLPLSSLVGAENLQILEKLLARANRAGQATEQTVLQRENADANAASDSMPVALTATALPDAGGAVLVIEDLSELLQAQRASAWQEVARRMAHEIKNPLTPIQLSAERIAKRFAESNRFSPVSSNAEIQNPKFKIQSVIDESTSTILREVGSLKAMVDEFSRFARLPVAALENGNLNDVVTKATDSYRDRLNDVEIQNNCQKNLPNSMLDHEQMRRALVNLIENAIEAFDDSQIDKKVLIKTYHDPARDLIVAEIADNAGGIEPKNLQKLFQPYFSTKGRGTGLGLAIVQRIIVEHGGKIKVVANQPKGAKFIIELPVNNA